MNYKYIFYAPYYQNHSNGIKCFWQAAFNFSQSRDVTILQFYNGVKQSLIPKEYESMKIIDDINKIQISKDHIVIYPDCVSTNPLNHHNVARYLMCKPFILNGQGIELNKYDYCFAYSNAVSEKLEQYLIFPKDLLNLKPQKNEVRDNKLLIYYGKTRYGLNFKGLQKFTENFDDVRIITREYPSKKSNLYQLISESRLLISFDPLTSLIHESTLLGTPVYIYDETFKEEYDKFNFKLHGFYYNLKENDLTKVYKESFNLAERAHNEIKNLSNSEHTRTIELIIKMEEHFSNNNTCYEKYTSLQKADIIFSKIVSG